MGLLAVAVSGTPLALHAQDASTETAPKKPKAIPFHGKLEAVDSTAKTISVGKMTIQVTSDTKIMKDGKPATLADGTVGENVTGSYRKDADGKLNASKITFGAKPAAAAPAAPPAEKQ